MSKTQLVIASAIAALMLSFGPLCVAQDTAAGRWEGTMVRERASLSVSFDLAGTGETMTATFNSPTQRAIGIPLRNVRHTPPRVHFELVGDATTIVFDGEIAANKMVGTFREGDANGTFSLTRVEREAPQFTEEEAGFANGEVKLSGTLLLPLKVRPHAAVVFLHGAGAEGRFASRFLAEHFARQGIAALIYDKRGVGSSTGDFRRSGFDELAGDALAAIQFLRQRKEIGTVKIGIFGHSQGGMIAPLVASRSNDVGFVISGAGSAVPVHVAEVNSVVNQVRAQGITGGELTEATAFIKQLVDLLRTGNGRQEFEAETSKVQSKKWYPMLQVPAKDSWFWDYYRRIADYDAAVFWQKVSVPVLVLYGEKDLYVPVNQSIANIDRALNSAGNKDYTLIVLPRASHSFDIEPVSGQPFEWRRIAPGLPDLLTAWINLRFR